MSQRHQLIYLDNSMDFSIMSCHAEKKILEQQVFAWLAKGLPCVYARQSSNQDMIQLGLSILYANEKHRVGLCVTSSCIKKQSPLPPLTEMERFFWHDYGIRMQNEFPNIAVYG